MCFGINTAAKPWTATHAWKVLMAGPKGRLVSPVYGYHKVVWRRGRWSRCGPGFSTYYGTARGGIYVYRTKALAVAQARLWNSDNLRLCHTVHRVRVRPEDFLHTNGRQQATYERVMLL